MNAPRFIPPDSDCIVEADQPCACGRTGAAFYCTVEGWRLSWCPSFENAKLTSARISRCGFPRSLPVKRARR